jgi:hypothetical protein
VGEARRRPGIGVGGGGGGRGAGRTLEAVGRAAGAGRALEAAGRATGAGRGGTSDLDRLDSSGLDRLGKRERGAGGY